jgi:hypothetical protein
MDRTNMKTAMDKGDGNTAIGLVVGFGLGIFVGMAVLHYWIMEYLEREL